MLLILALVGLLLFGIALAVASRHLPFFATWAIERALPGAKVEIHNLTVSSPNRLEIDSVILKSRKDGATLLKLSGGSVTFNFEDLLHGQIGEVRLVEPVLYASPKLLEIFTVPNSGPARSGPAWTVRRIVCDYGEITVAGYGNPSLSVQMKFAFDFQNFSPSSALTQKHEMVFWDFSAALGNEPSFFTLDLVRFNFDFAGISRDHAIDSLQITGGSLVVGDSLRALFSGPAASGDNPSQPWSLRQLAIQNVAVRLDDNRPDIPDITFALNTSFQDVPLSQIAAGVGEQEQTIEVSHFQIPAPNDPLAKVLTMESVKVTFSLKGLVRREIKDVAIQKPTIYVNENLFSYMDQAAQFGGGTGEGPGWKVNHLKVEEGQLVLGGNGRQQYGVPLRFRTEVQNVALDNLAALQFQFALEIPPEKYSFGSYQLEITSKEGDLRFSYPPEEKKNNLVGKVFLSEIRWRQYQATDAWLSVTFDRQGINGEFGGRAYGGYTSGGFSFFFNTDSPWIGWIAGKRVDLKQLTDVISPQNFRMTGPLDFKLQMDAEGKNIDRIKSEFHTSKPGKMVIGKIDDLLSRISPEWSMIKQSSMRIALEALKDFEYTKGDGNFWVVRSQGILQLKLQGPSGTRNFEIVLHTDDSPEGRWKKQPAAR